MGKFFVLSLLLENKRKKSQYKVFFSPRYANEIAILRFCVGLTVVMLYIVELCHLTCKITLRRRLFTTHFTSQSLVLLTSRSVVSCEAVPVHKNTIWNTL
jgi:hypothetical protein